MQRIGPIMLSTPASIAIIASALVACSTGAASTAEPSTGSSPLTFVSTRHGYSLAVPPGWQVTEYEGTWTALEQFAPGVEIPGEDLIAPDDLSSFLVVNSMAIPEAMTAADWRTAFDALVEAAVDGAGVDATCPATPGTDRVGGVPATRLEQRCDGSILIGRRLTHEGRGYYFTIRFPVGDAATEATLDGIVASIRFIDD